MKPQEVKAMIAEAIPNAEVMVRSDDEVHFSAVVVASEFSDLSQLKQQQLVYQSLGKAFREGALHALTLKTYTPDEWAKQDKQTWIN